MFAHTMYQLSEAGVTKMKYFGWTLASCIQCSFTDWVESLVLQLCYATFFFDTSEIVVELSW